MRRLPAYAWSDLVFFVAVVGFVAAVIGLVVIALIEVVAL